MQIDPRLQNTAAVYLIVNTVTGNFYVGSTLRLRRRALSHKNKLERGRHHNQHLQFSYAKYGAVNFLFLPILFDEWGACKMVEQSCLDANCGNPACYNIAVFIDSGTRGRHQSEETRKKIGAANAVALLGHRPDQEHRRKISEALKATLKSHPRTISEEAKVKMSLAKMGKRMPWNEGPKTDATKRRISETKLKINFTNEDWLTYRGMSEFRKRRFLKEKFGH